MSDALFRDATAEDNLVNTVQYDSSWSGEMLWGGPAPAQPGPGFRSRPLCHSGATCWILIHIPEIVGQRSRGGLWSPQTPLNGSQSRHLEIKREEGNLSGVGDTIGKKTQANGNLDICLRIKERLSFSPLAAVCPINLSSLIRVF